MMIAVVGPGHHQSGHRCHAPPQAGPQPPRHAAVLRVLHHRRCSGGRRCAPAVILTFTIADSEQRLHAPLRGHHETVMGDSADRPRPNVMIGPLADHSSRRGSARSSARRRRGPSHPAGATVPVMAPSAPSFRLRRARRPRRHRRLGGVIADQVVLAEVTIAGGGPPVRCRWARARRYVAPFESDYATSDVNVIIEVRLRGAVAPFGGGC